MNYVWHCPGCTHRNVITLTRDHPDSGWVHCPECQSETRLSRIRSGELRTLGGSMRRVWVLPLAAGGATWLVLRIGLGWDGLGLWAGSIVVLAIVFGINQEKWRG